MSGRRFGRLLLSIGVGTATMTKVAAAIRAGSAVSSMVELTKSWVVTSSVTSRPAFSSSIRRCLMSNPMVVYLRANVRATGSPT